MSDPTKLIESATKLVEETLKFFLAPPPQEPTESTQPHEKPSDS